jgi:hypothetical protein
VIERLATVTTLARRIDSRVPELPEIAVDPSRASFQAAALAPIGPLDAQRVLEADGPAARLELLVELLDERVEELRARLGE